MGQEEIELKVAEAVEGGYDASALGCGIFTQGEDLADLRDMAKDAIRCHFDDDGVSRAFRLRCVMTTTR